jgi:FdhD protein
VRAPGAGPTTDAQVLRLRPSGPVRLPDTLVTEEPLEIRAAGPGQVPRPLAVTMRTPGHDFELAAGFLWSEGVLEDPSQVSAISYCAQPDGPGHPCALTVGLRRPLHPDRRARALPVGSSCGLCGTASLEELASRCPPVSSDLTVSPEVLVGLPTSLRSSQPLFGRTGGLHAAGLFGPEGELLAAREDVGRHNAVDKLVGSLVLSGALPASRAVLVVSGRASYEIVQKAAAAGTPVVAAVSAASSLAVEAARRLGITLAGFVRHGTATVYCHPERLGLGA